MSPALSAFEVERIAGQVMRACGVGRVLVLGPQARDLCTALLRRGAVALAADSAAIPLAFDDASFDCVVAAGWLEQLPGEVVPAALREVHRVSAQALFLAITSQEPHDPGADAGLRRASWEQPAFAAGFRKHPAYYRVTEYESLNHEHRVLRIVLEKIPAAASARYPLASLAEERGLHMDMLRDSGERSDAHVMRYQWASEFIKPGDRVLDAACGLGYGAHVMARLSLAESIVGIDGSDYAIDYAQASFGGYERAPRFQRGMLPEALASFEDASCDVIVSFETLEHVGDPQRLLQEFSRVLRPGGRVIVSVPNDWSDESGTDPNPHHLHVYDWPRLTRELGAHFILDTAVAQTASQSKVAGGGKTWFRKSREFRPVDITEQSPADCEWWLMTAMKSPLAPVARYEEVAFGNLAASGHRSVDYSGTYRNPWLMHAMVNVTSRLRNAAELERLASAVMAASPKESNDYAAALCVKAYRMIDRASPRATEAQRLLPEIEAVVSRPPADPMALRWKVSLMFARARLLQSLGRMQEARAAFEQCAREDVRGFGIHLATKATESWFVAGKIAFALGDVPGARECWQHGVAFGETLLSVSLDEILINRSFPNRFNYGDGVREYALSWDNIARCANGLHLLARGAVDDSLLESSFVREYAVVLMSLREAQQHLAEMTRDVIEVRRVLTERTQVLERDLQGRTEDLVGTRKTLAERTEALERDLGERTEDLVGTRATLLERTQGLERASEELRARTADLVEVRATLEERTRLLEAALAKHAEVAREQAGEEGGTG